MKIFTEEELKKTYPNYKKDFCYVVAESYADIDAETSSTDELDEAKEEAKTRHYHIYVFAKKMMKACLDANSLLEDLVDNVEQEGVDSGWLWDMISDKEKQKFCSFVINWFNNIVGNSFVADEYVGELVEE